MPNVKIVTIFQSNSGYGWTETHYIGSQSTPPGFAAIAAAWVQNILPKRQLCLSGDCYIKGYRLSWPTATGIASSPAGSLALYGQQGMIGGSQNDSLACSIKDSTLQYKAITHLRGIWDIVVGNEAYVPIGSPANVQFDQAVRAYFGALIAGGYGWLSSASGLSFRGSVTNYIINANGSVTFSVTPNVGSPALPAVSTIRYSVKFARLNYSHSTLNRALVCNVTANSTLTSVGPVASGPFIAAGTCIMPFRSLVGYAFIADLVLGERRMGKSLSLYPGRRGRKPLV